MIVVVAMNDWKSGCDIDVLPLLEVDHGALDRSWEGILSRCTLSLQSCSCWCADQKQAGG